MRTKTLLLSAAVGAAGLLAADAQVYSVNSVGYVNLTVPPGFHMISNPLIATANTLDDLLPAPPDGTQVLVWNGTGFLNFDFIGDPFNAWSPNGDVALVPGGGVFINNPTAADMVITFVGEVAQGTASNMTLPAGFSIASSTVPIAGDLVSGMGFPSADGDQILLWDSTSQGYLNFDYIGDPFNAWSPSNPSVGVGQSFFVNKGQSTAWNRNFSVN